MDKKKRKQLEEKGFRVGSAANFLGLTPEEEAYIDIRLVSLMVNWYNRYSEVTTQIFTDFSINK